MTEAVNTTVQSLDAVIGQYEAYGKELATLLAAKELPNTASALPYLLWLKGEPYSLHDHFAITPLFDTNVARNMVVKAGRQVTKSTSLAAKMCLQSASIPYFSSLYVCPRYEQTRRFSTNYVRPFLRESPLGRLMTSPTLESSVLQRTFTNNATQHFSFAFLDCDRIRGISSDANSYDEVQDLDSSFLPVINETLSHSKYGFKQYLGTPKTFDNTLQYLYDESSQGEWVVPCVHCRYDNICCMEGDIMAMIQQPGVVCAKCGRLIDPRTGHWEHRYPDRLMTFPGLHVPQIIFPLHYADPDKWRELWQAKNKMPKPKFLNEKLGESCDIRIALLTRSDLMHASRLDHNNELRAALAKRGRYIDCVMGVDWGGGGEMGVSYTTIAVTGFLPGGQSEVIYGERLAEAFDAMDEVAIILKYMLAFRCSLLAHDFGGSGAVREILLIQAGIPIDQIFPIAYTRATAANMVTFKQPTGDNTRCYYSVDKARSLVLMCQMISYGLCSFPRYESWEPLATDFLALVEDKHETPRGADIYLITSKAGLSDDFAHSVNFAHLAFWERNQRYPDLAKKVGIRITRETEAELRGEPSA